MGPHRIDEDAQEAVDVEEADFDRVVGLDQEDCEKDSPDASRGAAGADKVGDMDQEDFFKKDSPDASRGASGADKVGDMDQEDCKNLRRQGLPSTVWVQRAGDVFVHLCADQREASDALTELTMLRLLRLRKDGLSDDGYLEPAARKEVVKGLCKMWMERPDTKQALQELRGRTTAEDAFGRTVASNFRTHCFQRFGGLGWVHMYAALGDVSPELVKL